MAEAAADDVYYLAAPCGSLAIREDLPVRPRGSCWGREGGREERRRGERMRRGEERRGERRREERGGGGEERRGEGVRGREGGREREGGASRERGEPLSLGTSQAVDLALAPALAVDLALAPALAGGHAICTGAKGRRTDLTRRRWGEGSPAGFPCVSARVTPRGLKMSGARRGRRGGR